MKFTVHFTFLLIATGSFGPVLGAKLADVIAKCETGDAKCFGFSQTANTVDAKCSEANNYKEGGCEIFASIKKVDNDNDHFTVILVAKKPKSGKAWVGIGFSEDEKIMKKDNFGVACLSDTAKVKVFNLQDKPPPADQQSQDIEVAKNQASIKEGSVELEGDHIICEFQLSTKPKGDGPKALDLTKDEYYIGLARRGDNGNDKVQPKLGYHGGTSGSSLSRGGSDHKLDVFKVQHSSGSGESSDSTVDLLLWASVSVIIAVMYLH